MSLTRRLSSSLVLALALLTSACSRDFPPEWASTSPASTEAEAAAPAAVNVALDEDPPLPGEASDAWIGLEQPAQADPHAHHHHHASPPAAEPAPAPEAAPETKTEAETKTAPKTNAKPKPKPAPEPEPAPEPAPEHEHHNHQPPAHEGHHHGH